MESKLSSVLESNYNSRVEQCEFCVKNNKLYTVFPFWCQKCNGNRFRQDFPNWTSGNEFIDKFIQETQLNAKKNEDILEWIPYDRLKNIRYLDKGGFSNVYKAIWTDGYVQKWNYDKRQWNRFNDDNDNDNDSDDNISGLTVVLKSLNNSSNLNYEFLNKWKHHYDCYKKSSFLMIRLYGFTRDPNNLDYIVVMKYADQGNLRKNLPNIVKYDWCNKLTLLHRIIYALDSIHQLDLIHRNLHDGNVLSNDAETYISDLGLCQYMDYSNKNDVYGVLPYLAPEILRGKPHTLASDIYSFSMIMWEITSGVPPFNNRAHDLQLGLSICKGERPEIIENTPQCYVDLMKKCWNTDPIKRPKTSEIKNIIDDWWSCYNIIINVDKKLENDIQEFRKADEILVQEQTNVNVNIIIDGNKPTNPQAFHTSRLLLDFAKKLNQILDREEKEIYDYKDGHNELFEIGITGSQSIGNY